MTTPAALAEPQVARGLEGIVSHATHLSEVDGHAGQLTIRGYDIHALAGKVSFEEAAYVLWHGDLPGRHQLDDLQRDMVAAATCRGQSWTSCAVQRARPAVCMPCAWVRDAVPRRACCR